MKLPELKSLIEEGSLKKEELLAFKKWFHHWPGIIYKHYPWHHHGSCCCCCTPSRSHSHGSSFSFDASIDLWTFPYSGPVVGIYDYRAEFKWSAPSGSRVTIQVQRHYGDGRVDGWSNLPGLENLETSGIRTWDPPGQSSGGFRICFKAVTDQGVESEVICRRT